MKKTETIDASSKALVEYELPDIEADVEVSFLDSDDLETIENGVRQAEVASELLAIIQGVGIVKIESERLYVQAGFDTLQAYRIAQNQRIKMPPSTVTNRRRIGEGWLKYRKALGRFDMAGHVQKLVLLDEAVEKHGRTEALRAFKSMSFREFKDWVRPLLEAPDLPEVDVRVQGDSIFLDGEELVAVSSDLPDEERSFLVKTLAAVYRARRGNLLPHIVPVYDEGEARAVDRALKQIRADR
jgi:hypothetical protein